MLEMRVTLEYACCACRRPVTVTLKCEGTGLAEGPRAIASVNVPCPHCGKITEVSFDPAGTVHAVRPYVAPRAVPEPSVN